MINLSWWLVDRASRLLEPDERDAVRGDFAELGMTGAHALHDLLGLVARRQTRMWTDWRPWLALLGLVVPLGLGLSLVSRYWATNSAIYTWLYVNNWTWRYLDSPGARFGLAATAANIGLRYLTLIVWSWTTGFALGSLSRRAVWVNGTLFCLVLFGGTLGSTTAGLSNPGNDAVFSLAFYRVVYPVIVRTAMVVVPALWGMQQGRLLATLRLPQAIVCALIVATLTAWAAQGPEGSVIFGWRSPSAADPIVPGLSQVRPTWQSELLVMLPLAMAWPAAYIVATANWRRRELTA